MRIIKLLLFLLFVPHIVMQAQDADSLIDTRDGKVYKIKKYGDKMWMTENLNYAIENSWCYGNDEENCKIFGRLYFHEAAVKACPTGWHLASDDEWQQLEKYLGMPEKDLNKLNAWRGTNQGTLLLFDSIVGFNALLGGYRNPPANNNLKDMQAFFWTSTEVGGMAYMRQLYMNSPQIFRKNRPLSWAFSVRCIKD